MKKYFLDNATKSSLKLLSELPKKSNFIDHRPTRNSGRNINFIIDHFNPFEIFPSKYINLIFMPGILIITKIWTLLQLYISKMRTGNSKNLLHKTVMISSGNYQA
jgi:hypothetical protein